MNEREKHEYLGFDRFLQVVNTKYENDLLEIEKKYYNREINDKEFEKLWNKIVEEIKNKKD